MFGNERVRDHARELRTARPLPARAVAALAVGNEDGATFDELCVVRLLPFGLGSDVRLTLAPARRAEREGADQHDGGDGCSHRCSLALASASWRA